MIHLPIFKGRVPIVPARSLPMEYAQTATNCDLSQGLLKGFYDVSATKTLTGLNCLDFDAQTGSFSAGDSLIGATSGATATVALVLQHGTTGTFVLSGITGTFQNNEIIYVASYGDELITNGDFSSWTGDDPDDWTILFEDVNNYIAEDSGKCQIVSNNSAGIAAFQIVTTVGNYYKISLDVKTVTAGSIKISDFTTQNYVTGINSVGVKNYYIQATSTIIGFDKGEACDIVLDDFSVKQITNAALVNGTLYSPDWRSIFPVESGGTTFWLCSQQEAHFVQAPIYASGERFYFTDGVRPKESNYALASNSGSNTYGDPYTSYYMGVPKPSAALTVSIEGSVGTSGSLLLDNVTGTWQDNEPIKVGGTTIATSNGTLTDGDYLGYDALVAGEEFSIGDAVVGDTSSATGTILSIKETSTDSVSYIYTFITDWGYEGEPSDPSTVVDIASGQYVELGNFEIPVPSGYNIVGIRIYRTSTGSDETDFQFVSEIMTGASEDYITPAEIVANSDVWDDKDSTDNELTDADDLGEVIATTNYIEPPSALSGLLALPNGTVAAYRTREVYLSEPFIHYGFPDDYIKRTNYDIKSIGHYGTTVIVGTEGFPYKITGYDPQSTTIEKLPEKQSCLFTRAMVSGPGFVLYPSPDGLYRIGETGNYLTTKNLFTKEQWTTLLTSVTDYDKTIIAFLYDDKYYAFFEGSNDGFIIKFEENINTGRYESQFYATFELDSTYEVYGGHVNIEDDKLYLLVYITDTYYIKEWEGDSANLVYNWKSKVFAENYTFYSCMKINGSFSSDSTGTGTITATGTAVEGSGTSFTTELKPGYPIYNADNKEYREVSSITDDDTLTLVSAFTANFSAKAFNYNSAIVNIYGDNSLIFTRAINSTSPFRIPSGYYREWEVEIKGVKQVYDIKMAQSMSELNE